MKGHPASTKSEANQLEPTFDSDGVQSASGLDSRGRELPDPVPMAPPVGYKPPDDLMTIIRRMVRSEEFNRELEAQGMDTFEDDDDFDVEDEEYDPRFEPTIYEKYFEAKAHRAAMNASQKATSRMDGAGGALGEAPRASTPPPSSPTSEAPKPAEPPSKSQTE